jgi:hypothetical protein
MRTLSPAQTQHVSGGFGSPMFGMRKPQREQLVPSSSAMADDFDQTLHLAQNLPRFHSDAQDAPTMQSNYPSNSQDGLSAPQSSPVTTTSALSGALAGLQATLPFRPNRPRMAE